MEDDEGLIYISQSLNHLKKKGSNNIFDQKENPITFSLIARPS